MPIKGITQIRQLTRLGKIKLGERVISEKSGIEHPIARDYFVCPDQIKEIYGPTPTELDVILPVDDLNTVFPQFYKAYGLTTGLLCKGDGEIAYKNTPEGREQIPCPGQECINYKEEKCSIKANLFIMLPKVRGIGVYQIDTRSFYGIVNLNSAIEMIKNIFGKAWGIPLTLRLENKEVTHKGKKRVVKVMNLLQNTMSLSEVARYLKLSQLDQMTTLYLPPVEEDEFESECTTADKLFQGYHTDCKLSEAVKVSRKAIALEKGFATPCIYEVCPMLDCYHHTGYQPPAALPTPTPTPTLTPAPSPTSAPTPITNNTQTKDPLERQISAIRTAIHVQITSKKIPETIYRDTLKKIAGVNSSLELKNPETLKQILDWCINYTTNINIPPTPPPEQKQQQQESLKLTEILQIPADILEEYLRTYHGVARLQDLSDKNFKSFEIFLIQLKEEIKEGKWNQEQLNEFLYGCIMTYKKEKPCKVIPSLI